MFDKKFIQLLADFSENPYKHFVNEDGRCFFRDEKYGRVIRYNGASKNAFILENEELVIKMPRLDDNGDDFGGVGREIVTFRKLPANIKEMFAPILEYGKTKTSNGRRPIPYYITEKGSTSGLWIDDIEQEYYNLADELYDIIYTEKDDYLYDVISRDVVAHFIKDYGIEKTKDFYIYCQEYDINDLHDNNFGFFNGKLKCIDYSGYNV